MQKSLQLLNPRKQLPKPTIDYAIGNQLDPDDIPANGTAVWVDYTPMVAGERIELYWDGVERHTDSFPRSDYWPTKAMCFPVPKTWVLNSVNTTVQLYYTVTRAGGLITSDKPLLEINIANTDVLPAPTVVQAAHGRLDPLLASTGAIVRASYRPMFATDRIGIWWQGSDGFIMGAGSGTADFVDFVVPTSVVAASLGKTVTIFYTVVRKSVPRVSELLSLTVPVAKHPLAVDTTPLELTGISIKVDWPKTGLDAEGNTAARLPTDGVPPYTYASRNPEVATVSAAGLVTGESTGSTTISISDADGGTVSYSVYVANVFTLTDDPTKKNYDQAVAWMNTLAGVPVSLAAFRSLRRVYKIPGEARWLCTLDACGAGFAGYWRPADDTYGLCHSTPILGQCAFIRNKVESAGRSLPPLKNPTNGLLFRLFSAPTCHF